MTGDGDPGTVILGRVSKTYRRGPAEVHALRDVSLRVEPGEFVVLLGPSGSGKTTLLNLVGTIEPPSAGTVTVSGIDVTDLHGRELTACRRAPRWAYVDSRSLYDTARGMLSLFYAFVGVMLACGGVTAFALLFNTASVNAAERAAELAALELTGTSSGQVGRLLAGETMLLTVLSIAPGLAVGYWVSAQLMASFSSDLFDFGMEMRGSTLVLSSVAIVMVATLAQWSTARTVARLDIARVVRERSS